jgi:hypothetical protein
MSDREQIRRDAEKWLNNQSTSPPDIAANAFAFHCLALLTELEEQREATQRQYEVNGEAIKRGEALEARLANVERERDQAKIEADDRFTRQGAAFAKAASARRALAEAEARLAKVQADLAHCALLAAEETIRLRDANQRLAKVPPLIEALKQIASAELVTEQISDPLPDVIDGEITTVTYTRSVSDSRIAREALAAWEQQ